MQKCIKQIYLNQYKNIIFKISNKKLAKILRSNFNVNFRNIRMNPSNNSKVNQLTQMNSHITSMHDKRQLSRIHTIKSFPLIQHTTSVFQQEAQTFQTIVKKLRQQYHNNKQLKQLLAYHHLTKIYQIFLYFSSEIANEITCVTSSNLLCQTFKEQICNQISKSNVSQDSERHQEITGILQQLYDCRRKIRNLQRKTLSQVKINEDSSSKQNTDLNYKFSNSFKKSKASQSAVSQEKQKSSNKLLLKIYHNFIELKQVFMHLAGSFWKLMINFSCPYSETFLKSLNKLRINQLTKYQHKSIEQKSVIHLLLRSKNQLKGLTEFAHFIVNKISSN